MRLIVALAQRSGRRRQCRPAAPTAQARSPTSMPGLPTPPIGQPARSKARLAFGQSAAYRSSGLVDGEAPAVLGGHPLADVPAVHGRGGHPGRRVLVALLAVRARGDADEGDVRTEVVGVPAAPLGGSPPRARGGTDLLTQVPHPLAADLRSGATAEGPPDSQPGAGELSRVGAAQRAVPPQAPLTARHGPHTLRSGGPDPPCQAATD